MKPLSTLFILGLVCAMPTWSPATPILRKTSGQNDTQTDGATLQMKTRSASAGELELGNGIVRAGSNTSLRATGNDSVVLDRGLAVVASKPRFFRPSVSIQTPRHQFQVRGTAQIFHEPGKPLRVVVIEGRMTISLQSLSREKITLRAGEMLVIDPLEPALPEPLDIDLDRLVSTAQLLAGREFDALPTQELVTRATRDQADESRSSSSGNGAREARDGIGAGAGEDALQSRPEELVHLAIIDDLPDLDGDGEPDDLDELGDLDELDDLDDLDQEELDDPDQDDAADDDGDGSAADDPDDGGGDKPDPGE
jgi:hypothetical protein